MLDTSSINYDLAKEVARLYIEFNKELYMSNDNFEKMCSDYFNVLSKAYSLLKDKEIKD